jgi:hypothetical protein
MPQGAGLVVEVLFQALGLVPDERDAKVIEASVTWNYTTLNIAFLALSAVLVVRFLRTGGPQMLRMMAPGDRALERARRARRTRRPRRSRVGAGRRGRGVRLPDAPGGSGRARGSLPQMRDAARATRRFDAKLTTLG